MHLRDRIKEFRRVPARELKANPRNWRIHPERQKAALRGILREVGYAGALLARECDDGSLELIDGHLRVETTPDQPVPVLVLDVDAHEAEKILATHDPLSAMAQADIERLDELMHAVDFESEEVQAMLADLAETCRKTAGGLAPPELSEDDSATLEDRYQILVNCRDEAEQAQLLVKLVDEGYSCRALIA